MPNDIAVSIQSSSSEHRRVRCEFGTRTQLEAVQQHSAASEIDFERHVSTRDEFQV